MYYRVRTRFDALNGRNVVIADNVPTLEKAYEIIIENGKGRNRHFMIDEVEPILFSKLTAKIAEKRLEELKAIREEGNQNG